MLDFLQAAVASRLNIIVSGGTGAGKTTLLNVLSGFISDHERVVTIEDAAELMLRQRHVVRLETRPANIEGKGAVRQRELVINALRMRPDRIIVGEVRGEEALDMLQAMNTGHDGSLTTIHANSARDALYRLDTMVAMANLNIPERAVRQQIASAVNLIVQVTRLSDGTPQGHRASPRSPGWKATSSRCRTSSCSSAPASRRDGKVCGRFRATGIRPKCSERLASLRHPAAGRHVRAQESCGLRGTMLIVALTFVLCAVIILGVYWTFVVRPEDAAARALRRRLTPTVDKGPVETDLTKKDSPLSALKVLDVALVHSGHLLDPIKQSVANSGLPVTIGVVLLSCGFVAMVDVRRARHRRCRRWPSVPRWPPRWARCRTSGSAGRRANA